MLILVQDNEDTNNIDIAAFAIDGTPIAASALKGDLAGLGAAVAAVRAATKQRDDELIEATLGKDRPLGERLAVEKLLRHSHGTINFWPDRQV